MAIRTLYVTCTDIAEAKSIGQTVVAERLAACANILDGMTSIYRWEDKVVEDREVVLLLKTTVENVDALTRRIVDLHSYDLPCVVSWVIDGGHAPYLDWVNTEVETH